jgi:hypothetical protein
MELTGILCQIKLYKTRAQKMFDCEIRIAANGIAARRMSVVQPRIEP